MLNRLYNQNVWRLAPALLLLVSGHQALAQSSSPPPDQKPNLGPSPEVSGRLELVCLGGGSANKTGVVTSEESASFSGSATGPDGTATFRGSGSSSAITFIPREQSFSDQMDLFIENGEGRIRVPRVMLPPIRGGENGWFKLNNVEIDANEITASVAINFINNPKLRVDRRTGVVNLSGKAGDFVGRCQRAIPQERQF